MSKLTSRWLDPGATAVYSCVFVMAWFGFRYLSHGDATLFEARYARGNALVVAVVFGSWLVFVLIRASQLARRISNANNQLDLESKQQTAFLTGLALLVTASLGVLNAPSLRNGASSPPELLMIGSGTVVDWMSDRGIKRDNTYLVEGQELRVRVIEAASDDGLGIMVSAYSHGREQDKSMPTIVALASYDVDSSEAILLTDKRPSAFFKIELARSDTVYFVRSGKGQWPTAEQYGEDPLGFLLLHKHAGATVYGGQQHSGTRKELERVTCRTRSFSSPMECTTIWSDSLGSMPTSLDLDAIAASEPAVLFGTGFRTRRDNYLEPRELRLLAADRGWSVVGVYLPRPLLVVGRLTRDDQYLPASVRLFLRAVGWNDPGLNSDTGEIERWTPRLDLIDAAHGHMGAETF